MSSALLWFRNDLRINDNPALTEATRYAATHGGGVVGVVIISTRQWQDHFNWGLAKADYYLRTAHVLKGSLSTRLDIPLITSIIGDEDPCTESSTSAELIKLCAQYNCSAVFMNAEYDGYALSRDAKVCNALDSAGIVHHMTHDQCVVPVGKLTTKSGTPYKIFSQFKKTWVAFIEEHGLDLATEPERSKSRIHADCMIPHYPPPGYEHDESLDLEGVREAFPAGEEEANNRLAEFLKESVLDYHKDRNHAKEGGASRLSAPLNVGSISPKQCLIAARKANHGGLISGAPGLQFWISELCWREFYRHVLFSFPHVGRGDSFRVEYQNLSWRGWPVGEDPPAEEDFTKWCKGLTGVPIVDAAMRELKRTAWQPNRLRMIVAMYLTKDLLIHWRRGEAYFQRHLVDYDYASNNGGWQWSASTGTDAQPYFRIFNPLLQSEKFDDGDYIRRWVPELAAVKGAAIHEPFKRLPRDEFEKLGYPQPMIDHAVAKRRALALFTSSTYGKRPIRDQED
jgi:deoxyribodipyrimidine photo-lyase